MAKQITKIDPVWGRRNLYVAPMVRIYDDANQHLTVVWGGWRDRAARQAGEEAYRLGQQTIVREQDPDLYAQLSQRTHAGMPYAALATVPDGDLLQEVRDGVDILEDKQKPEPPPVVELGNVG